MLAFVLNPQTYNLASDLPLMTTCRVIGRGMSSPFPYSHPYRLAPLSSASPARVLCRRSRFVTEASVNLEVAVCACLL